MKIALYEYIEGSLAGFQTVYEYRVKDYMEADKIRVSEWLEVDFPMIPHEELTSAVVESIDKQIEEIKDKALNEVAKLQTKRAEILAISHDA
jgi:hypothetical protein